MPHVTGEYLLPWHVRSWMLALMHKEGIPRLTVDKAATLNAFINMNPDMSGHLTRLRSRLALVLKKESTVSTFLKAVGSCDRPELLSMWLCFTTAVGMRDSDFEEFASRLWRQRASDFVAQHGLVPHPSAAQLHD